MKSLDRELFIDSKLEEAYRKLDGNLEHQDQVTLFLDFPFLYPGKMKLNGRKIFIHLK